MKNTIIIKNSSNKNIEKSVVDLANMYANTRFVDTIEIYQSTENGNTFVIKFPNRPDFERFSYFVNYLAFPMDIKGYHPRVFGIWKLPKKINKIPFEIGETIGLYLSKKEEEYDNVYILNSKNSTYKYTFYGKVFKANLIEYKYDEIVKPIGNIELHKKVTPSQAVIDKLNKPWWKFW